MVLFVDLEGDEDEEYPSLTHERAIHTARLQKLRFEEAGTEPENVNPPDNGHQDTQISYNSFSAVLSCYPSALTLSCHLDLNDLYSLSLTCKAIHKPLLQFRHNLITNSLRCTNDANPLLIDQISRNGLTISDVIRTTEHAQYGSVPVVLNALSASILASTGTGSSASTSRQTTPSAHPNIGKLRHCARDLVAPCRKCGTTVCRNCAAKPPSDRCLKDRYRRLCASCLDAPLEAHLVPSYPEKDAAETPPLSSASSTRSNRSSSNQSTSSASTGADPAAQAFTHTAFQRSPCTCSTRGATLCSPCGSNLRASDTTYKRVWTWRSRYSTHIGGGLGTGLGEGDQGQKCGRGSGCLEAGKEGKGMCWVEIDCSEGTAEQEENEDVGTANTDVLREHEMHAIGFDAPNESRPSTPRMDHGPGYLRQEVEGLGGVMKKKVKKRVKVGATVWEYDDERESGKYLEREASGEQRSWCGWCGRVVLGREDRENTLTQS